MKEASFLETQIESDNYQRQIKRAEDLLGSLQDDLNNLKNVENPTHANQILLKLYTEKLLEAMKILN